MTKTEKIRVLKRQRTLLTRLEKLKSRCNDLLKEMTCCEHRMDACDEMIHGVLHQMPKDQQSDLIGLERMLEQYVLVQQNHCDKLEDRINYIRKQIDVLKLDRCS